MEGAKGQFAFSTKGHARKSLVHTGWWTRYKKLTTVRKLMPFGDQKVDGLEQIIELRAAEDAFNHDPNLTQALRNIESEINTWIRNKDYREEFNKIKFDKQKRFAVELLTSVETKEIT
jgi:hypothetical protein